MLSRTILDSISDHIAVLDHAGTIILVNAAWERFAQENGDADLKHTGVGVNYLAVCRGVKGHARKAALAVLAGIEAVLEGKLQQFSFPAYPCHSALCERWFLLNITPMPQAIGGVVVAHINVTERRQEEQLSQKQDCLALIGQLATGIGHDFNNVLSVITLYSQLLLKSPTISQTDTKRLQVINKQAYRAARLLTQIMDFSPQSSLERRPLELKTFLTTLTEHLKKILPENIQIQLICAKNELLVNVDVTRLESVFLNLAINARAAMADGGILRLETAPITTTIDSPSPVRDMPPGQWAQITITNTGIGIAPQTLPHIFEPFFSTKNRNKGIGLGLAQVYNNVKRHDGFINAVSDVDRGTSFTIYLPVLILPEVEAPPSLSAAPITGCGETILVVEDAPVTGEATSDILKLLNYTVLTAKNGKEALRLFTKHADDIALVLSDLLMPGMDGISLYQRLHKKRPGIKMMLMTKSTAMLESKTLNDLGIVGYIAKPFDIQQIAQSIHLTLHEQSSVIS